MAFQLSPGVLVTEKDLTSVVPAVATSIGGIAGYFTWGPANEIVTVDSENMLRKVFGTPTKGNAITYAEFFTAASFLAYSSNLKVVRAYHSTSRNAVSTGTAVLIKNQADYVSNYSTGQASVGMWAAKYFGLLGNSLRVSFSDSSNYSAWAYKTNFDYSPTATAFATAAGASNDELHIIVIDQTGSFTGVPGTILEKFAGVSKALDAKDSVGRSNYYVDVINERSEYIYWMDHPASQTSNSTAWGSFTASQTYCSTFVGGESTDDLQGGLAGTQLVDGDITAAYSLFINDELVDVNLLMAAGHSATVGDYLIDSVAEVRKDCMVFISPQKANVVDNAGDEATDIVAELGSYTRSSYAVMDSGYKYMYDRYNNSYRWVPCNGDVAGACANTDSVADPWFSPAGYNRGAIKNAIKLAYSPSKTDRDTLYKAGVNPIVGFPGNGIVLFGDKTMLNRPSAFDRINVRRLFIVLEKAIATAAKFQLFEFNDAFTRAQFSSLVEPFLRDVQGRRGIYDFKVVCNDSNNTSQVIDSNQFVADIFIQPAKSINFIQLNFIATRTGISFEEVGG